VPFGVLNFIDADSVDLAEHSVFQTPGDDMVARVEDLVPGSAKGLRRLFHDSRLAQRARKSM
jgi:hypothetical protein